MTARDSVNTTRDTVSCMALALTRRTMPDDTPCVHTRSVFPTRPSTTPQTGDLPSLQGDENTPAARLSLATMQRDASVNCPQHVVCKNIFLGGCCREAIYQTCAVGKAGQYCTIRCKRRCTPSLNGCSCASLPFPAPAHVLQAAHESLTKGSNHAALDLTRRVARKRRCSPAERRASMMTLHVEFGGQDCIVRSQKGPAG